MDGVQEVATEFRLRVARGARGGQWWTSCLTRLLVLVEHALQLHPTFKLVSMGYSLVWPAQEQRVQATDGDGRH